MVDSIASASVLVLGGCGFTGRHLVSLLVLRGAVVSHSAQLCSDPRMVLTALPLEPCPSALHVAPQLCISRVAYPAALFVGGTSEAREYTANLQMASQAR